MSLRGENLIAAAAGAVGGRRFRERISTEAAEYWSVPVDSRWEANSHWRASMGDEAWLEVGTEHLAIFSMFAKSLALHDRLGTVIEWGCGGGANAVAFAPLARQFIGADISEESLAECEKQVDAVCDTPVHTRRIDLRHPEAAAAGLQDSCSTFLCLYVVELTSGPDEVRRILRIAQDVLVSGGMALVQTKYHTGDRRTKGRPGVRYARNLASTTTFTVEEFWDLATDCGLQPQLIHLVPQNRLDRRYAYYALVKP